MLCTSELQCPSFCPNPACAYHRVSRPDWRYCRIGFYTRHCPPRRIQRYRCGHCGRRFSSQTFSTRYWLKRPDLLLPIFHRLLGCSGYRQIAREFGCSPQTILTHAARLGRHCLLFHEQTRPRGPLTERLALDSFVGFEFSQYHPTAFHVACGRTSHFFYGFTDSELRRSGRMTSRQKRRRLELEQRFGRPNPRATELDVTALIQTLAPDPQPLAIDTDEHDDYPRAFRRLPHLHFDHRTISSRAARTSRNPLFEANLIDLLIRHSSANHKRETIAFSKRRQSAIERMWVMVVWRNWIKHFSERRRDATPAMRLGLADQCLSVVEILRRRLFPHRIRLSARWALYYWRQVPTRRLPRATLHELRYAG